MARLTHTAFLEGFPHGVVALFRQANGRYRIVVSRPPNNPDATLAEAEQRLCEMIEFQDFFCKKRKPFDVDEEDDEEDED